MAKVYFNDFHEACAFSKQIAIATKTFSTIHREGNKWWVQGLSIDSLIDNPNDSKSSMELILALHRQAINNKYDEHGYDTDGINRNGYDRFGYDRFGYDKNGYDKNGLNRAGYDIDGYYQGKYKLVDKRYWIDKEGKIINTGGSFFSKETDKNRTIYNTPTAIYSRVDGDNNID